MTTPTPSFMLIALLLSSALSCSNKPPDTRDYATRIDAARTDKNTHFLKDSKPVPEERKAEFLPLAFFPIDPDYSVPAILKRAEDRTVLQMPTSTGGQRQMRRVGSLEFSLKGQSLKLTAFVEVGAANLD